MPNGDPNFNLAELERFFAPFAATIQRFAARRNVELVRYYHETPNWDLCFTHPTGGFGKIFLAKSEANTLAMSATVWIDDYKRFTRRSRRLEARPVPATDDMALTALLDSTLDEMLSWPLDERFIVRGTYKKEWSSIPESVFYSAPKWPTPVPNRSGI